MSDAQNENAANAVGRTAMEDLPQAEQELSADEAKNVKGGLLIPAVQKVREAANRLNSQNPASDDLNLKGVAGDGSV